MKDKSKSKHNSRSKTSGPKKNQRTPNFSAEETRSSRENCPTPKGVNDPAWYDHNPQLVKDVANLPFNQTMGLPVDFGAGKGKFRMPGIMTINYVKAPGIAIDNTSPINVASRDIYSFVRHANSGSRNYEAVDYMLYLLAMGEAFSYVSYLRKILGCVNLYAAKNRYLPRGIYEAMAVDYDDVIGKIAQLRAYANSFIARISALKVPATMDIYKRWTWMDEFIFADHKDISNAQFYVFTPQCFRTYEETESTEGGVLKPLMMAWSSGRTSKFTVQDLVDVGEQIIQKLLSSEDIGIMSGDTIKAYGDNVYSMSFIDENYTTPIVYDEEVLMTIQNTYAPATHISTHDYSLQVYQDPTAGTIKFLPELFYDDVYSPCGQILNMPWENPTPMDVMIASRMRQGIPDVINASTATRVPTCGSELVLGFGIVSFSNSGILNYEPVDSIISPNNTHLKWKVSTFSWHPIVVVRGTSTTTLDLEGPMGPLENIARLTLSDQIALDNAALLSLYNVPTNM